MRVGEGMTAERLYLQKPTARTEAPMIDAFDSEVSWWKMLLRYVIALGTGTDHPRVFRRVQRGCCVPL